MKLLILGLNYAPEKVGIAVYTAGMAEALVQSGHQVDVIAGQPYYPNWKIGDGHNAWQYTRGRENGVDVTRVPHYIPSDPSVMRRLMHHASFGLAAFFPVIARAIKSRPDVVLTVGPSLVSAPVARLAALMSAGEWSRHNFWTEAPGCATATISPKQFASHI